MIKKLLVISIFLVSALYAGALEDKIIAFEKKRLANNNKRMVVKKIKIIHKEEIKMPGWHAYILDIKIILLNRTTHIKDILFTNGTLVATDLAQIDSGESLKKNISPKLNDVFYNKAHLIMGNHKAKQKIVVFSDPLCKECKTTLPQLIKHVKKNSDKMGLYYYHFPLEQVHPAALTLSKAMKVATKQGIDDIWTKIYNTDFSKYFDVREKDDLLILNEFNKLFNTNITLGQIQNETIQEEILSDKVMGNGVLVNETPAIYVNGIKDRTLQKYKTLGK